MDNERSAVAIKALSLRLSLLARQLYVMDTEPVGTLDHVYANLEPHLRYWATLEQQGVLFAAGPKLPADETRDWPGGGMVIYRAESLEEAVKIARDDPMHESGARRFTVNSWLMNHFRA
jgi:uncharacterized protein